MDTLLYASSPSSCSSCSGFIDKDRAVTGRKASGYLIVKVHMTWGIDQVEDILFAVLRLIDSADSLGFDRDAALALELHIVENLRLHLTAR